jgi:hypothetical protein
MGMAKISASPPPKQVEPNPKGANLMQAQPGVSLRFPLRKRRKPLIPSS